MSKSFLSSSLLLFSFSISILAQVSISIENSGFESNSDWTNLIRSNDGYYSPVEGDYYASANSGSNWIGQMTDEVIEADATYSFTVYARSTNLAGVTDNPTLQMEFYNGTTDIWGKFTNLEIPHLSGAPETYTNDDGANIWIDGNYRMQFNEEIMYQTINQNPMLDPWTQYTDADYDVNFALGQINIPQGLKALYGTFYEDNNNPNSAIFLHEASGNAPDYTWLPEEVILSHDGDQEPWVIDAHVYHDEDENRLWMTWGGHKFWISELDPTTGKLLGNPPDTEFDTHPAGMHTQIAEFTQADAWSDGYHEGPALFKKDGFWYCFGTYGNLSTNYTIRYGRATNPQGPYFDRDGNSLNANGGTLLFGDEGEQLVPGHPHIWEENGQHYIGYDYRKTTTGGTEFDYMGIRKLFWEEDWPTIYQPITLTIEANDYPAFIGQPLGIRFRCPGNNNARIAIDEVSVIKAGGGTGTGTINFDSLFAPPTQAEIDLVIADWNIRDVECYNYIVHESAQSNGLDVEIVSHDTYGLSDHTHYGFVRYPENYDPSQSYPVLVVNHGGQGGTGAGILLGLNGCYNDFIVVAPSFRGEPLNGSQLGLGTYLSEAEQSEFNGDIDDALALLNCVLANVAGASPQGITVMGGSRGGGVTYLMSIRDARIAKINDYFGATDHLTHPGYQARVEDIVNNGSMNINPPINTILTYSVYPYQDGTITLEQARLELLRRSVYHFDHLLPSIIQIHHGALDFVVEVEHSQRLTLKLTNQGMTAPNFEYFEYADGTHGANIDPNDLRRDFICNMDFDGDSYSLLEDCDESNAMVNPNQTEIVNNGIDDDCDPSTLDNTLGFSLQVSLFLEGAYIGNGNMHNNLIQEIPLSQPYAFTPYNYNGTESLISVPPNMVDWVLVEARSGTPNISGNRATITEETKVGILLTDGNVQGTDGNLLVFENLNLDEPYYFCIRHRNHLDILTASPIMANANMSYDFTSSTIQALGSNQLKLHSDGMALLFAGEFNQDGVIQTTDFDQWQFNPAILNTYMSTDANLDGTVQTTDYDLWFANKAKVGIVEIGF